MDNWNQMMGNLTKEQLHEFEVNRIQKETQLIEQRKEREKLAQTDLATMRMLYGDPTQVQPQLQLQDENRTGTAVVGDMPQQIVDEKESKRIKREKTQFKDQTKLLKKHREEKEKNAPETQRVIRMKKTRRIDEAAKEIFMETLRADMFTPRYVLEHFAEVREKLDTWRGHLQLFEQGGAGNVLTTRDQQMRLVKMREMYMQGELAFRAALGALGYQYDATKTDASMVRKMKDTERKQAALEENRALRTVIAERAAHMDIEIAEKLLEETAPETQQTMEEFRQGMAETRTFGFIHTDSFSQQYHYDEMLNAKELIDGHPEEYAQNREMVDKLYAELFHLMEVIGIHYQEAFQIMNIQSANKTLSHSKAAFELQRRLEEHQAKMAALRHRAEAMKAGMKFLLQGKQPDESLSYILQDFVPLQDIHQQRRVEDGEWAKDYAKRYNAKKEIFDATAKQLYGKQQAAEMTKGIYGRFMMLMETGQQEHNEKALRAMQFKKQLDDGGNNSETNKELGRMVKPLILPYLERLKNFDTKMLEHCKPEELIARADELQELSISGMQIVDLGKIVDPDDPEGRSIKETFYGQDKELFALKCSTIQSYATKARALSIIKAYKQGTLEESVFTETETGKIRRKLHLDKDTPLTKEQLLLNAKELLSQAETSQNAAYNAYFQSPKIMKSAEDFADLQIKTTHPAYREKLNQVRNLCAQQFQVAPEQISSSQLETFYQQCDARIKAIEQQLGEMEEPGMAVLELHAELEKNREYMEYARNLQALTLSGDYKRAGESKSPMDEPMFRSYDSAEGLPAFQAMSEDAFALMCRKMSAGTFEDQSDPLQQEAYYAENMEGLRMYKERIREHYEMLEETFHHQLPSTEYIMEHELQLKQWFANTQMDTHIVSGMRDLIDLTKPEDLRLYHLVNYYNAMAGFIAQIKVTAALGGYDYADAAQGLSLVMQQEDASREYLEHAPQPNAQSTLRSEKFRQAAEDAPLLLQADEEALISYLPRFLELENYVEQHPADSSLEMEQYKGWLELIQRRLTSAMQKLPSAMQETVGGFTNYVQSTEAMYQQLKQKPNWNTQDKVVILKPLQEAGQWLKDLTRYVKQPLELSKETFFDDTIMTLMSMFGYIESDLRKAKEGLNQVRLEENTEEIDRMIAQMEEMSSTFAEFKEQVPGQAQELRTQMLQSEEKVPLTLRDIIFKAQKAKTFRIEGKQENVGAGSSDVIKLREGDKLYFFKEEEIVQKAQEGVAELLPLLGNGELRQLFEELFQPGNTNTMEMFFNSISMVRADGTFSSEETKRMFGELIFPGKNFSQLVQENQQSWTSFILAASKRVTAAYVAENPTLKLEKGADLTVRNYASERVAELLGLKGLIVRNQKAVVVNENGEKKKGFIMDQAKGVPVAFLQTKAKEEHYEVHATEDAQKQLLNLQILDNIIGQSDRHMGNLFVEYEEDVDKKTLTVKNITGIDNDFAFGFSQILGGTKTRSIADFDNTKYLLGMMDRKMYENLMTLSPELLATNLEGVIEQEYMDALKKRFETVRKLIKKAKEEAEEKGEDFFREKGGWNLESERQIVKVTGTASYLKQIVSDK